ncbi:class I SAM-dependent methyltransferase [Motiliproteus sp.]|uniref:class I SAM-dependent methyltransferase n=1 Tax=Motiliproteus sp. TaxID=1898955 RepID=UPI003BAD0443
MLTPSSPSSPINSSLNAAVEAIEHAEFTPESSELGRWFHGRGHCYPGLEHLNIDWLPPVMLITLYQAESQERLQPLVDAAMAKGVGKVALQHRYQRGGPIDWLLGESLTELVVTEQGLKYGLQLGRSQNHGLFLDMANGRQWLRQRASGARVLNLFAYTCGFSVAAVAGGARTVVNLDMSKGALKRGQQNHQLNDHDLRGVRFLPHDLFRSWGKLRKSGPYDRVVIDPPSFQRGSFVATEDYQRVLRRLPELLLPEAELLVCLNDPTIAPDFLIELMQQHCPNAKYVERLANPDSFPEQDPNRALKVLHFHYQAD